MMATVAPVLLERARAAYEGQLMLMKGPEVAAWYRDPSDRGFRDLDLLADDAPAAQRALIKAGFVEFEEFGDPARYSDAQHLCPLILPGLPLVIELHRHPNQPWWLPRLSAGEVLQHGVPSATGVDGLLGPEPAVHALLLVAHGWAHHPLARLRDLLDVAAVLASGGRHSAEELAREWGWDGMWRVALAVTDAVLGDDDRPAALNVWARHLSSVRDRTVLENHIARVAAPAQALPVKSVPAAMAGVLWGVANRGPEERWADKLRRSRLAICHALMATSRHDQTLPPGSVCATHKSSPRSGPST
jgi:hypothetical protein